MKNNLYELDFVFLVLYTCKKMHMQHMGDMIYIEVAVFKLFSWSTVGGNNMQVSITAHQQKWEKKKTGIK